LLADGVRLSPDRRTKPATSAGAKREQARRVSRPDCSGFFRGV
jgi:hypothetical protein